MTVNEHGNVEQARQVMSPNQDSRPGNVEPNLIVMHSISLPIGAVCGPAVEQLFLNTLDCESHPDFASLRKLRVSAHFFVRRSGELVQFVPASGRAWHAGVSEWRGRSGCNDFSIGIEMEGLDKEPFVTVQYQVLSGLLHALCQTYPIADVVGHCDIAPGRKTDPGPLFDWRPIRNEFGLLLSGR